MKNNTPFVSVIVPVKGEERYIKGCIDSLLSLDYPKSSYEIIVVLDKKATDGVKKALKQYDGRIKVIQSKKAGSAANRNLGVKVASKKAIYFAFTDADCVVDRKWIYFLVKRMEIAEKSRLEEEKNIGCVGGLNLVPESDNRLAKTIGAIEQTIFGGGGSAQVSVLKKEKFVNSIPTCNALYKRWVWEKFKQDEKLIVGQDGEMNYRLRKKGVNFLVIPEAIVWHHRTNTLKGFIRRMFRYGKATAKIFLKHKELKFLALRWYGLLPVLALFALIILIAWSYFSIAAFKLLAFLIIAYAIIDLITALAITAKTKSPYSLISFFLIPMQHLLYAIGFISGLFKGWQE
ncbi:MAG: glycosyltransferase [Candidatus Woesearchaeota archaeon]|nr:glycosyltransferase [Candidatus Woesearchaeota archaeon]